VGLKATVEGRKTDNYRDHNELQSLHASLLADFDLSQGRLFAEVRYSDEEIELPGPLTNQDLDVNRKQVLPRFENDANETQTWVARIGGDQRLGNDWQLEAEVGYRDVDTDGTLTIDFDQRREHWTFTPRLVGSIPFGNGDALITAGLDWDSTDYFLDFPDAPFLEDAEQDLWAIYAQAVLPFSERLTGTFGARYAEVKDDYFLSGNLDFIPPLDEVTLKKSDDATAWEAGLAFQATKELRIFGRIDTPFRFAKIDEAIIFGFGVPPSINPLEVQTGESLELGIEWARGGLSFKSLAYRLDLEDEIGLDPTTFTNINYDDTRRDGLTFEGSMRLTPSALLSGQLSFIDASFRDGPFQGNDIPMVAEKTARLSIDYSFAPAWSIFGEAMYIDERYLDGDFENVWPKLHSATMLNANLRYSRGPWAAEVRVTNLTDQKYSDYGAIGFDPITFSNRDFYYPAPEQRWFLTVGYQFN
jgi:iron complex outermembrane receptor protein